MTISILPWAHNIRSVLNHFMLVQFVGRISKRSVVYLEASQKFCDFLSRVEDYAFGADLPNGFEGIISESQRQAFNRVHPDRRSLNGFPPNTLAILGLLHTLQKRGVKLVLLETPVSQIIAKRGREIPSEEGFLSFDGFIKKFDSYKQREKTWLRQIISDGSFKSRPAFIIGGIDHAVGIKGLLDKSKVDNKIQIDFLPKGKERGLCRERLAFSRKVRCAMGENNIALLQKLFILDRQIPGTHIGTHRTDCSGIFLTLLKERMRKEKRLTRKLASHMRVAIEAIPSRRNLHG
ncbi:MAG: hypothetical protein NTY48_02300 [Candidatus Diapherotrites archaeon]|nr:hypothetical protein [Candidatus Diapherotrites archaeon]